MLLHNDVVTDGEPKPGTFSGRFRCEERVEHLFFYVRWNTGAAIPNRDFNTISKATNFSSGASSISKTAAWSINRSRRA
jgi:hypothetical protein